MPHAAGPGKSRLFIPSAAAVQAAAQTAAQTASFDKQQQPATAAAAGSQQQQQLSMRQQPPVAGSSASPEPQARSDAGAGKPRLSLKEAAAFQLQQQEQQRAAKIASKQQPGAAAAGSMRAEDRKTAAGAAAEPKASSPAPRQQQQHKFTQHFDISKMAFMQVGLLGLCLHFGKAWGTAQGWGTFRGALHAEQHGISLTSAVYALQSMVVNNVPCQPSIASAGRLA
jgi:hypothetical protein